MSSMSSGVSGVSVVPFALSRDMLLFGGGGGGGATTANAAATALGLGQQEQQQRDKQQGGHARAYSSGERRFSASEHKHLEVSEWVDVGGCVWQLANKAIRERSDFTNLIPYLLTALSSIYLIKLLVQGMACGVFTY